MLFGRKSIEDIIDKCQEIFDLMSEVTACFTGHRAQKLPWKFNEKDPRCIEKKENAKAEIEKAIQRGYTTFLCGMAFGFDMICAEIVLELKKKYQNYDRIENEQESEIFGLEFIKEETEM